MEVALEVEFEGEVSVATKTDLKGLNKEDILKVCQCS